ncbi:hypothetical protein OS493_030359 [Desmophyllum pertusum]|uniref:Uncharacterized protein n=1 Tax=Desmophyllum pertusum TaxID=174260 RepID=A0A9X0CVI8_9CNID|nr:hypothetical protein OS493_030359 [Desmophyllum pertusum]
MAARAFEPLVISREEWDDIFGSSDEEMDGGDSDIDVSEMGDESDESESESESEIESEEWVGTKSGVGATTRFVFLMMFHDIFKLL